MEIKDVITETQIEVGKETVTIKTSDPAKGGWLMIHDGEKVIAIIENNGKTVTRQNVEVAETLEELQARAKELKLKPEAPSRFENPMKRFFNQKQ